MRTPSSASPAKVHLVFATLALSAFTLHCSTEDPAPGGTSGASTSTSGSGGVATGGSAGSITATGGVTTTGGSSSGGATAGTAGTTVTGGGGSTGGGGAGGGGAGGAAGGGGGAGGSGGGSAVSFGQIRALLATSCKGSMCHDAASTLHVDWVTEAGLHSRLTTAIPSSKLHCGGKIPVVPGNPAMSLLYQSLNGTAMCSYMGMMETIKMPKDCGKPPSPPANTPNPACFTPEQIKLVEDWITAGAPM